MTAQSSPRYPIAKPWITEHEISRVTEVLKSGHLSLGPLLGEFETKFAGYLGTRYAAAISSGTAGLHLALRCLKLQEGDEVITSPFSFIASANSILYERAVPRFVDIDRKTLNMDPVEIESAITPRTRAILVVHIFGYPADMDAIQSIARRHHLPIVEDACESLGATYHGKKMGTFGNPAVFAFYPNKQMTTGEGGMVVTDDLATYQKIKSLSNQGRNDASQWLQYDDLGYNYRLSDLHCAVGLAQLEKLDDMIERRRQVAERYHQLLGDIEELELVDTTLPEKRSWFIYPIWTKNALSRDTLMQELDHQGIACRPYLPSIHLQSFYQQRFPSKPGSLPISEDRSAHGLAIPFYIGLEPSHLEDISDRIHSTIAQLLKGSKSYV